MDTARGDRVEIDDLAARLDSARLILFGETHAHAAVQQAERQLLDALARRGRRVLVGLEMLPASVQPALDRWVRGEGSEADLVRDTHWYRHWGFHFGHYRELFLFARQRGTPLVALNVEREVITTVRRQGFEGVPAADRPKLPPRIDLDSAEHRRLFSAYMGGGHQGMTPEMEAGMFRAQCTWDAVMGWNAVRALERESDPRAVMVAVMGSGHVAYGLGVRRQAALWGRPATALVVAVVVEGEPRDRMARGSLADFVWGVPPDDGPARFPSLGATLSDRPGTAGPGVDGLRQDAPAARAGIRKADVIVAVDGVETPDKEAVLREMAAKAWDTQVQVTVVRAGTRQPISVSLTRPGSVGSNPPAR